MSIHSDGPHFPIHFRYFGAQPNSIKFSTAIRPMALDYFTSIQSVVVQTDILTVFDDLINDIIVL